ncbi:hypothetical protein C4S76_06385 [Apibacter adventoris]|nr:hypothetical protein C4S76_06385 [Apibacter adventoris]
MSNSLFIRFRISKYILFLLDFKNFVISSKFIFLIEQKNQNNICDVYHFRLNTGIFIYIWPKINIMKDFNNLITNFLLLIIYHASEVKSAINNIFYNFKNITFLQTI